MCYLPFCCLGLKTLAFQVASTFKGNGDKRVNIGLRRKENVQFALGRFKRNVTHRVDLQPTKQFEETALHSSFCLKNREAAFGRRGLLLIEISSGFKADLKLPVSKGKLIFNRQEIFTGNIKKFPVQKYLEIILGNIIDYGLERP